MSRPSSASSCATPTSARAAPVLLLAAALACGGARADDTPPAALGAGPVLAAVWRAPQACAADGSVPALSAMQPHPEAESIQRGRIVSLPAQHLQFQVPAVPGVARPVLRITPDDRSRGALDQVLLFAPADTAAPVAAVVVTDLPRGLDSRERAFDSVQGLERRLAQDTGAYPSFGRVDGPYGEALEMIVPGRAPSPCFPTARFVTSARLADGVPFGISRFAFTGNRLVEFSLVLAMPARMTLEDQHAQARAVMDAFWGGMSTY